MYNDISDQIKKVAKYLHLQEVCIDSCIFKLHYVATVVIFLVYSLLVTISTYAGDPIDCITSNESDKEKMGDYLDWWEISIINEQFQFYLFFNVEYFYKVLLHSRTHEFEAEA